MRRRIGMVLVLAGALAAWAGGQAVSQQSPGAGPGVAAAPAGDGDVTAATFTGLIRPSRRVQLAMRVGGVIAERPVRVGDAVTRDQLIARLDSRVEEAAVAVSRMKATSEHQIQAENLTRALKQENLTRIQGLHEKNAAADWELRQAQLEVDLAAVRTEYARFQKELDGLELARDEAALAQRELRAPYAGRISQAYKDVGEAVQELTPVVELVQLDPLWVEANVPATPYRGAVRLGQRAEVTVAGRARDAAVIMVDPEVDAASDTFRVRLELANADGAFDSGKLATIRFSPPPPTTQPEAPAGP